MKKYRNRDLHLVIIWQNGRYKQKEILNYISNTFQIVEQYEINWNKNNFSKSLTSFYGTNLPPNSKKELHCGNGKFLVITFYDLNPNLCCLQIHVSIICVILMTLYHSLNRNFCKHYQKYYLHNLYSCNGEYFS